MWFNKKDEAEEPAPRTTRGRKSDMRTELGLGGDDYTRTKEPAPRATRRLGTSKVVSQDAAGQAYTEDVLLNDLKVRARQRLIGAFVLLAAAFVILPWVFDDNRKVSAPVVSVSVPEQKIQFEVQNPRATSEAMADNLKPVATENPAEPPKAKPEGKQPEKPVVTLPVVEPVKGSKYVVHIGLVSSKAELDGLMARLAGKGVKPSTEAIKLSNGSNKTRVRLGPFDSQAAAQAAADKIKGAAKKPVVIEVK